MMTVSGYLNGVSYAVEIDPEPETDPNEGTEQFGVTHGSPNVIATLAAAEGREHLATPTGPSLSLDRDDADSVVAALLALTEVTAVTGDTLPEFTRDPAPGVIH